MARRYPIYVDVEGRRCCVVGGGRIAEGRARTLLEHGAELRLVAPQISPGLEEMLAQTQIDDYRDRAYRPGDLEGCLLVIAATDRHEVNLQVAADARAAGAMCNVATDAEACDFTVPAVVRRGDLTFAVTTEGASPAVIAEVRHRLESAFGPEWGILLDMLSRRRAELRHRHPDPAERAAAVRNLLGDGILELIAGGRADLARHRLDAALGDRD